MTHKINVKQSLKRNFFYFKNNSKNNITRKGFCNKKAKQTNKKHQYSRNTKR